jgi:hypothetical protein
MVDPRNDESTSPAAVARADSGLTRDEYFSERQLLIEARQRSYQRAEQMVIGGATGSLLLSITFVEKLVPGPTVTQPFLLLGAWLALLGCLSLNLFGQYSSASAFDCEIGRLEASVHGERPAANGWATCNRFCGGTSAILLVVGITVLAWFAYVNAPFS